MLNGGYKGEPKTQPPVMKKFHFLEYPWKAYYFLNKVNKQK